MQTRNKRYVNTLASAYLIVGNSLSKTFFFYFRPIHILIDNFENRMIGFFYQERQPFMSL